MNTNQMKAHIANGGIDAVLAHVYGDAAVSAQKTRYSAAIDEFAAIYGADREISLYSVAGRSELSGNHTDHNHGCVVAASIDLDIIAVASAREDSVIRIKSEGFPEDVVDFSEYTAPVEDKFGSSASIIAGMCAGFTKDGYAIGGFDAYTTSNVLKGSGLSSSAAFEDMVGNILNHMYNDGKVDNVEIAKLAQYSENVFFGKPCGLMDQVACAVGGIVAIDFNDPKAPIIDKVAFDISGAGYNLCIVNTGGNHADLTDDYASVPAEMKAVAAHFGKAVLRDVDEGKLVAEIPVLREKVGDRAVLRALHFFAENKRVAKQKEALLGGDLDAFFAEVLASGKSSFCYLQNVYTSKNLSEQGLSLALCLAEQYLASKGGAWRVHGGGFAGTIQAYVSMDEVDGFKTLMDSVFGEGKCIVLRIRPEGAVKIA
ncbi:MAG: galactokinase [Ruminococcaceae bacterium]|nr:galactokinase [Oscillospiraceae bacterium]